MIVGRNAFHNDPDVLSVRFLNLNLRIVKLSFLPREKMEADDEQFQSFSSDTSIISAESDRDEEELESPVEFIEEDSEVEVDLGEIAEYVENGEIHLHFGGYEYEFVDEVLPSQKCPVCLLPMKDPVQTIECGHRFCRGCLEENILRSSHPVCPNDRQEIEEEGGFYADKAWARDILSLRIKCQQNSRGCEWIGQLRYAEEHQEECPYEHVPCSACQGSIQRRLLGTHLTDECPKRIVECVYCEDEFFFIEKQPHEDIYCKRFPLVCENNCGHDEIPREEMASHVSEKCLMTVVLCPYFEAGCPFEDKRAYLKDHLEVSVDGHLEMAWNSLILAKKEISTMKDKFYEVQEVNQEMKESVAECRSELRELSAAVNKLVKENVGQKKFNQVITEKIKIVEAKIPQKTTPEAYGIPVNETMRRSPRVVIGKTVTGGLTSVDRIKLQKDALDAQRKLLQSYTRPSLNNTD